jgi:hypothetical protein
VTSSTDAVTSDAEKNHCSKISNKITCKTDKTRWKMKRFFTIPAESGTIQTVHQLMINKNLAVARTTIVPVQTYYPPVLFFKNSKFYAQVHSANDYPDVRFHKSHNFQCHHLKTMMSHDCFIINVRQSIVNNTF